MAGLITIELTGEAELQAQLADAVARLREPTELLQAIGGIMETNTNRRFDTKSDPEGRAWAPLASSTLERYAKADKGRRRGTLLERTRALRGSLAYNVGSDFVDVGFSRKTDSGKWDVGQLHEFGTTRMPRRGLLTADPEAGTLGTQDRQDIEAEVARFLDELFGA